MPLPALQVRKSISKKGFRVNENDHHRYVYWSSQNIKSNIKTKVSHSAKEISDDLLSKMAGQCKLSTHQFLDLIECPMDRKAYERTLIAKGEL